MPAPYIDFDQFAIDALPSNKRLPKWKAWMQGLLSQTTRLNYIFNLFGDGTSVPVTWYDASSNYGVNDTSIYNYKVYMSLVGSNIGNTPDLNPLFWQEVCSVFIGASERAKYTSQKICLEWVLNRYFKRELDLDSKVGFVQPDDPITPSNSSIYISYNVIQYPTFLIGFNEAQSSYIGQVKSSGWITESEDFTTETSYRFIVNIPTGVYTYINSDSSLAEKVVRNFLDKYVAAGLFYDIQTY